MKERQRPSGQEGNTCSSYLSSNLLLYYSRNRKVFFCLYTIMLLTAIGAFIGMLFLIFIGDPYAKPFRIFAPAVAWACLSLILLKELDEGKRKCVCGVVLRKK